MGGFGEGLGRDACVFLDNNNNGNLEVGKKDNNNPEEDILKEKKNLENFRQEIEIANNNMFDLISPYPDLVSHIGEELKKDTSKNQQFLMLGYIAGETSKYLGDDDKMKSIVSKYINVVNEARQSLKDIEFYNMFRGLTEKIKEVSDKLPPSKRDPGRGPFVRTFYPHNG